MRIDKFEVTAKEIRPRLVQAAKQSIGNDDEVEDLVQETLLRLWLVRSQWKNYQSIEAVAVRIIKNCIIDNFRKKKLSYESLENQSIENEQPTPHQILESGERWEMLQEIILQLPNLQRLIITMKDIEGYETEEIAKITDTNIEAVRMNLSRARKKVKEMFLTNIEK
jgi:RNA polymerase sigma-70 factor (ECF subfamily)